MDSSQLSESPNSQPTSRTDIERLEGKWKLNQNHPAEQRSQIIRGPQSTGRHEEVQIAELMQATLEAS